MGKTKNRKYQAKPKALKVRVYFSKQEKDLIKFVANELLGVTETQFIKGAAVEMAQATLKMAQEKAESETNKAEAETNEQTESGQDAGAEETTTESGVSEPVSEGLQQASNAEVSS